MAIYSRNGQQVNTPFNQSGEEIYSAFDVFGTEVYAKIHTLKVMTYNVGTWYVGRHDNVPAEKDAEYYALQKGIIQQNNADILFLEEYCKEFSKTGRTAISILQECGYTYIHEQGGDNPQASNANGRCIASKFPISNYVANTFNDGGGMYYDYCSITVNGETINLVITHLHWQDRTKRASEMATIMTKLSDFNRFIFAGDFNSTNCYDETGLDYPILIEPLLDAGYNVANCSDFGFIITYSDEPDDSWTAVLDNIVTPGNMPIISAYRDETKFNDGLNDHIDHVPFIAIVEL